MKIRFTKPYKLYNYVEEYDMYTGDTVVTDKYNTTVNAYVYPLSGDMYLKVYGEELQYMYRMLIDNAYKIEVVDNRVVYNINDKYIKEGDKVCVFNPNKPDFIIKSIQAHGHLVVTLELIH